MVRATWEKFSRPSGPAACRDSWGHLLAGCLAWRRALVAGLTRRVSVSSGNGEAGRGGVRNEQSVGRLEFSHGRHSLRASL